MVWALVTRCLVLQADQQGQDPDDPQQHNCGELVGYVDDGAYGYAHHDPVTLSMVLNSKYKKLEDWMNGNKLVINPDKTHLMVMGTKGMTAKRRQVTLTAGSYTIKPTKTEKLLGGVVNEDLKWNQHISDHESSLMRQLTSRLNGLRRTSHNATFNTKLMVANGILMSKMVYLITLWGGAQQYLLKALLVQQLTAARIVCGFYSFGWSKRKLLNKVGWLSVRQLIFFHTVLQAQKTIASGVPRPLHARLTTAYPYETRSATQGMIRFCENVGGPSMCFKYRAMQWFNSVPVEVRTGSLETIKKNLSSGFSRMFQSTGARLLQYRQHYKISTRVLFIYLLS